MQDVPLVLIDPCRLTAAFPVPDVHVLLDLEVPEANGALRTHEGLHKR